MIKILYCKKMLLYKYSLHYITYLYNTCALFEFISCVSLEIGQQTTSVLDHVKSMLKKNIDRVTSNLCVNNLSLYPILQDSKSTRSYERLPPKQHSTQLLAIVLPPNPTSLVCIIITSFSCRIHQFSSNY